MSAQRRPALSHLEDWHEHPDHPDWPLPGVTEKILGRSAAGTNKTIPLDWVRVSLGRTLELRNMLRDAWVGLDLSARDQGHLTDWLLACLIAREPALLLGPPGTAKTEMAERTYALLGLEAPTMDKLPTVPIESADIHSWWKQRESAEGEKQKYFSFLLNRFTEPEEIFGPVEISLLRRGMLVRVNFGMLTGPGVRAAFLDEVFKGSASILNSMLRLVLNREFFNWGGMRRSDLLLLIAASNELPGGMATGEVGVGASGEDFQTLYAFLDRFPMRLLVPEASGSSDIHRPEESHLAQATELAIGREQVKFQTSEAFAPAKWQGTAPCLNDLLLLGRALLQQDPASMFDTESQLTPFKTNFLRLAAYLQQEGTGTRPNRITWTISPRKLKALWKIALAYAVVRQAQDIHEGFSGGGEVVDGPGRADLHVFDWIWDTPTEKDHLEEQVLRRVGKL